MVERIRTLLIKLLGSEKRAIQLESAALLPTFEVLKTEVGTTYLGKIPGRTDHNIRPSYDSSGIAEVDAGQGLAVMVCDGAGPSEGARRLGKRMVATFMAAVHKMKANESFIDHSTELLKTPTQAVRIFNKEDTSGLTKKEKDCATQ